MGNILLIIIIQAAIALSRDAKGSIKRTDFARCIMEGLKSLAVQTNPPPKKNRYVLQMVVRGRTKGMGFALCIMKDLESMAIRSMNGHTNVVLWMDAIESIRRVVIV
jgi:hypothetical protein